MTWVVTKQLKNDWKACLRTARQVFLKNRPYFAHFFVTERCNLRCDYCNVWKKRLFEELDLQRACQVVDLLDQMGVCILSLTGGEPLLREDVFDLIGHARSRKLFTRITSNGTLPLKKYESLLKTDINAFSISLDAVDGDDLPRSKVSPRILETIEYLYRNRGDRPMSIATLYHERNTDRIDRILEYVQDRFPGVGVFVQPVVVGTGDLRVSHQSKVDPTPLMGKKTMAPDYFLNACLDYYHQDRYDWGCKAGQIFFDVKPNGDFWICQDVATPLNVLAPDFLERWKESEFIALRASCAGCIYSCYYMAQRSFEWQYLPGVVKQYFEYRQR